MIQFCWQKQTSVEARVSKRWELPMYPHGQRLWNSWLGFSIKFFSFSIISWDMVSWLKIPVASWEYMTKCSSIFYASRDYKSGHVQFTIFHHQFSGSNIEPYQAWNNSSRSAKLSVAETSARGGRWVLRREQRHHPNTSLIPTTLGVVLPVPQLKKVVPTILGW